MPGNIIAEYTIELKGIHRPEGIECMGKILQVYLDDLAKCFDLSIGVELMDVRGIQPEDFTDGMD
jgi:hypothetical protein